MQSSRPTILICVGVYLPGYRGGGPIRSLSNLADNLVGDFDFKVLTADHDVGVDEPYPTVEYGHWQEVGSAEVRYLSRSERLLPVTAAIIAQTKCDVIYLNAFFPTPLLTPVLLARRLNLLGDTPIVICPRGHLHPGALEQKAAKKQVYLRLAKAAGLYEGVLWHATNAEEATHIRAHFGVDVSVQIAPNLGTSPADLLDGSATRRKQPGQLRAMFLSRISPKKNLIAALRALQDISGDVVFDIYGPIGDKTYWAKCRREIDKLPEHVSVHYHGGVSHDQVFRIFADHDLFIFPTQGENFGHVIFEALTSGCPVLISDQTPWRNLEVARAGWDLPLNSPQRFKRALQWCINASESEYEQYRKGARKAARRATASEANIDKARKLFERALS